MANEISIKTPDLTNGFVCDSEPVEDSDNFILSGAVYSALGGATISDATTEVAGKVKMATNVAEATGDNPTAAEFKALLDALIGAGIMAEAETE